MLHYLIVIFRTAFSKGKAYENAVDRVHLETEVPPGGKECSINSFDKKAAFHKELFFCVIHYHSKGERIEK